jgi:hypothetical protein
MKIRKISDGRFAIEASATELAILNNCILNLDNLCGEGEFHTYVGATKAEAEGLRRVLHSALDA